MKRSPPSSSVRIACILLTASWGAWVGFGGYLKLKPNSDSFAMMFALGYFVAFAVLGLIVGTVVSMIIWSLVEKVLTSFKINRTMAMLVALLINLFFAWVLTDSIYSHFPGLRYSNTEVFGVSK